MRTTKPSTGRPVRPRRAETGRPRWTAGLALTLSALTLVWLAGSGGARADDTEAPLEAVKRDLQGLRYPEAATRLSAVLAAGGLARAQLVEAHLLGGYLYAALGDGALARHHFLRCVALDPQVELPAGTSPKIRIPLEEARAQLAASGPLRVRPRVTREGQQVSVELSVASDPLQMVAGVRVAYGLGRSGPLDKATGGPGASLASFRVPAHAWLRLRVSAVDDRGNQLTALDADEAFVLAPVLSARAPDTEAAAQPRAWYRRWYTWAAVAGAASGAALYFGLRARADQRAWERINADSAAHSYGEARSVEVRGRRNALLANVGLGVAGGATAAALYFVIRRDAPDPDTMVTPTAGRRGAGVLLTGHF